MLAGAGKVGKVGRHGRCGGSMGGLQIRIDNGTPNPQTEGTGNSIAFRVRATQPLSGEVTFNWQTVDGTAIGNAAGDFTKVGVTGGVIPVDPGYVDVTVQMSAADAVWKPDRTFFVDISDVAGNAGGDPPTLGSSRGVGRITDSSAAPTLSISDGTPDPAEQGTNAEQLFDITATVIGGVDYLIDYDTRDGTAPSGSYTPKSGTTTLTAGASKTQVPITINASPLAQGIQNYFVDISNARATLGTVTDSLTITDSEGQGNIKGADAISMGDGTPSPQTEGVSPITFRILSSGTPPLPTDITGTWRTQDGTAVAGEAGSYTGQAETSFTILAANGFVDVTVNLETADAVWAPDRSFTAEIVTSDAPISDPSGTGTITDSLTKPTVATADGVPNPAVKGTHSIITFVFSCTVAPKYDLHIDYATADDTAVAGTDYVAASGTAIIPAGQTSVQVQVTVIP